MAPLRSATTRPGHLLLPAQPHAACTPPNAVSAPRLQPCLHSRHV
jgi:hypothetical protein